MMGGVPLSHVLVSVAVGVLLLRLLLVGLWVVQRNGPDRITDGGPAAAARHRPAVAPLGRGSAAAARGAHPAGAPARLPPAAHRPDPRRHPGGGSPRRRDHRRARPALRRPTRRALRAHPTLAVHTRRAWPPSPPGRP